MSASNSTGFGEPSASSRISTIPPRVGVQAPVKRSSPAEVEEMKKKIEYLEMDNARLLARVKRLQQENAFLRLHNTDPKKRKWNDDQKL